MKKINYILILLLVIPIFLNACQGIKDGLSGRKSENSNDEISKLEEETDIKKILNINTDQNEKSKKNFGSAEEFVLKNIK